MWTTRQKHLAQALNNTALAIIAEAQSFDPAEAREMNDLAVRLDELRIRLLHDEPKYVTINRAINRAINHGPSIRPAA